MVINDRCDYRVSQLSAGFAINRSVNRIVDSSVDESLRGRESCFDYCQLVAINRSNFAQRQARRTSNLASFNLPQLGEKRVNLRSKRLIKLEEDPFLCFVVILLSRSFLLVI